MVQLFEKSKLVLKKSKTALSLYNFLTHPVRFYHFLLLKKNLHSIETHNGFSVVEFRQYHPSVLRIYHSMNRDFTLERAKNRFTHGLHFFALKKNEQILASAWIIPPSERFIDEIGLILLMENNSIWLRDIYIPSQHRGKGLFTIFLDLLLYYHYPNRLIFYSDVLKSNSSSMRAHLKYGFEIIDSILAVVFFNKLLWRIRLPKELLFTGFQKDNRIVLLNKKFQKFTQFNIA